MIECSLNTYYRTDLGLAKALVQVPPNNWIHNTVLSVLKSTLLISQANRIAASFN